MLYIFVGKSIFSEARPVFYNECGLDKAEHKENPPCPISKLHEIGFLKSSIISIHVFGWKRYTCLERTLTSLNEACYPPGINIDLTIWFDKGYNEQSFDTALKVEWVHGKKVVRTFTEQMGVRGIWMNFWYSRRFN